MYQQILLMRKNLFHLLLVAVLTLGVTDYLWIEIFQDEQIVAEFETDKKKETEESVQELREFESKEDFTSNFNSPTFHLFVCNAISHGFVKHGSCFIPCSKLRPNKIFILFHRLRIFC